MRRFVSVQGWFTAIEAQLYMQLLEVTYKDDKYKIDAADDIDPYWRVIKYSANDQSTKWIEINKEHINE